MIQMEYAIRDNRLLHISEVESGLKCRCHCPACGDALIARKGKVKAHHFAHRNSDCAHGVESALHIMAKEILEEERKLFLPEVAIQLPHYNDYKAVLYKNGLMEFDSVTLEKRYQGIVPDILVSKGNRRLIVEIYVTHKVDGQKLALIKDSCTSAIEIDLSIFEQMPSREELRDILINHDGFKMWLYHKKRDFYLEKWRSLCEEMPSILHGWVIHVANCPLKKRHWQGRHYANLCDDCWHCDYYFWNRCDEKGNETGILCAGKNNIKTLEDLKEYIHKRQRGL